MSIDSYSFIKSSLKLFEETDWRAHEMEAVIGQLCASLTKPEGLPKINLARISYILDLVKVELVGELTSKVGRIFTNMIQAMQFMHEEALIFGVLYPHIKHRYADLTNVKYEFADKYFLMPEFFVKIEGRGVPLTVAPKREGGFESHVSDLKSFDLAGETEEFDVAVKELVKGYAYKDNHYYIIDPFSITVAEKYMGSSNQLLRALAQFMHRIHINEQFLKENRGISRILAQLMAATDTAEMSEIILTRIKMVPLLAQIVILSNKCRATCADFDKELFAPIFVNKILTTCNADEWVEQISEVYDIALRISNKCREFFVSKSDIKRLASIVEGITKISLVREISKFINKHLIDNRSLVRYFVSKEQPLCKTKETFILLCSDKTPILEWDRIEKDRELAHQLVCERNIKKQQANIAKKIKRQLKHQMIMAAAASKPESELEMPSVAVWEIKEIQPIDIFRESRQIIDSLAIHPRVSVWGESYEAGLAYYGEGTLSEAEMVLRHRFPPELMLLAFHPLFSDKGSWLNEKGEEHDHWESIVHINGRKFMLEATVDKRGVLYHFYTRPILGCSDYTMISSSPSEFPTLGDSLKVKASAIDIAGIKFDGERGNAILNFEGNVYKVLRLRG